MRIWLALVSTLFITACDPSSSAGTPDRQAAFIKQIQALEEKYDAARDTGNDLKIEQVEAEIEKELKQTNRRASAWTGVVDEVTALSDTVMVTVTNGPQAYHLELLDPKAKQLAADLSQGDRLTFSGDLGHEVSFTNTGAVSEPEFRFPPASIRLEGSDRAVAQDPKLIQAEQAAQAQALIDADERAAVMEVCQRAVQQGLRHPESADFSWTQAAFGKTQNGNWVYEDVVEAINDLGAEIPMKFRCVATASTTEGNSTASVIDVGIVE